jgi:thiol-disulfide isomerase/thioredoxin
MKSIFFTLLLLPALVFAQQKTFTITGNISGLPDGDVQVKPLQGDQPIATGTAKAGSFTLKGSVTEPALYWLVLGKNQPQYIFLENGNIKITGSLKDINNLKVEGSNSHKEFMEFQTVFNPIFAELNNISGQVQQANDQKRNDLIRQYTAEVGKLNAEVNRFVSNKKSSYVSPFLLFTTAQVAESPAELQRRFNLLDDKVKNSESGKNLSNYISYISIGSVGTLAVDFTQNDTLGHPLSLSSFKGKYVLVDFWASWCQPCRRENPNIVKLYDKYKDKNFAILSVSLDNSKEKWLNAIKEDRLTWNHISDLKYWNNEVAVLYKIQSIPQNFLVDPEGVIISKDLHGENLDQKLKELLK